MFDTFNCWATWVKTPLGTFPVMPSPPFSIRAAIIKFRRSLLQLRPFTNFRPWQFSLYGLLFDILKKKKFPNQTKHQITQGKLHTPLSAFSRYCPSDPVEITYSSTVTYRSLSRTMVVARIHVDGVYRNRNLDNFSSWAIISVLFA